MAKSFAEELNENLDNRIAKTVQTLERSLADTNSHPYFSSPLLGRGYSKTDLDSGDYYEDFND